MNPSAERGKTGEN